MPFNFVSVSGVTNKNQLEEIANICTEELPGRNLVIGYQVSNKSINQGVQNSRQPVFSELGDLDVATRNYGLTTAIHYYTRDFGTIIGDLEKVIGLGIDPASTLLQFNTLPLPLETLSRVKELGFGIIFKVPVSDKSSAEGGTAVWKGESVEDISNGTAAGSLVSQVYGRKEVIDYVMFDPSHGTNLSLDLNENSLAIKFGKEIVSNRELSHLGLVYAGGINPSNVRRLMKPLTSHFFGRVSIDAESGVRINDELDLELVRDYLRGYNREPLG